MDLSTVKCYKLSKCLLNELHPAASFRDLGGGGAGRATALALFCWDLFSRAPVDMEKVIVELLDFSLKGGR